MLMKLILKDQIRMEHVNRAIKFCEKYLPKQGPLEYFVHHNTLHAFEEFNFFDALKYSSSLFRVKTHKTLNWYQSEFKKGRIFEDDLLKTARKYLTKLDNEALLKILFWNENITIAPNTILRDKLLSKVKVERVEDDIPKKFYQISTFWDFVKNKNEKENIKGIIKNARLDFYSAFFDKGNSYWPMEGQAAGLLSCYSDFVSYLPATGIKNHTTSLIADIESYETNLEKIEHILNLFGIPLDYLDSFLFQVLYDLKGWSALVFAMAENKNYNPTNIKIDLHEYILTNLLFEAAAYKYLEDKNLISEFEYKPEVKSHNKYSDIQSFIYDAFNKISRDKATLINIYNEMASEISQIDESLLFKIWHEAYEYSLIEKVISSYALARSKKEALKRTSTIQVITCIDDREESTRRYFEEYDSSIKTYGYAGHFGLNIQYKSIREAHFRALCPLSASPDYFVWEVLKSSENDELKTNRLAKLKHFLFHNSKLPLMGLILTFILAPFTLMLFLFESFMPSKVHSLRKKLKRLMFPKVETRLDFLSSPTRDLKGYTIEEATNVLLSMLKITGVTNNFAEIVFLCGHGSKSMNNPHGAAYNCGACAGGKGAPNARLMATIANRSDVRKKLEESGVIIPSTTFFVGGYHCTSSDKLLIFEKETFPKEIMKKLEKACRYVEKKDAKERLRKFEDVPLNITNEEALVIATNRAYDFSQPRPEYGHNTNAFCIVGKRENTKDIFLDRRAFLVEYEEKEDDESSANLLGLLSAVIPVCAGINLEYYFSYVDRENFGAGGKQAHNVNSLMGVMNGFKSDLRLGLPWQMVEIHEPLRIICIIEASPKTILQLMEKNQNLKNLIGNDWVKIICVDCNDEYSIYESNAFNEFKPKVSENDWQKLKKRSFDSFVSEHRKLLNLYIKSNT